MPTKTITVNSPIDGRKVGAVPERGEKFVTATTAALRAAQPDWAALSVGGRVRWLATYRDWLLDNADRLSDILRSETGKPAAEAPLEIYMSIDVINYYGENGEKFLVSETPRPHNLLFATKELESSYQPYQLVGIISPWNFPLALSLFDMVPALVSGSAVAIKPSSVTPLTVQAAIDGWAEIGAPPVVSCITGRGAIGSVLVDRVDFVQFTGSTETGKLIAQRAAARLIPYSLELGGKDPAIVLADADLEKAARGVAYGGLSNAGQMCTSLERIYVEAPVYDEFLAKLVEVVSTLRQGGGDGSDVDVSSLISADQLDVAQRQVDDAVAKGATVLTGGKATGEGYFFQPTVLSDVDHSMLVMTEETFGPLLPVMKVADAAEAVRLANDSEYGLSASVWSSNKRRAKEVADQLEVGSVDVNDASAHLGCFALPQSGWKQSGVGGRLGGASGIRKFCQTRAVVTDRIATPLVPWLLWFPYGETEGKVLSAAFRAIGGRDIRRRLGL